ncbi:MULTISPECIES: polysaccharide biosynthesis tyrosine autokinase [Brevibacterium]|uniref:Polysaccharide biosynthesis tyrosine autokinase n=1 Tax=Brevibacterium casei TaxID=33889 RepID=A0A7T3ZZX8_9MICO|nr:polysaccharide biosynthesis tyrosine autokinase [Brevibacterium casei]QQB14792.1 polysaccharide biosynthesis tyrosine autokinase [Brevibacterium casei]
MKLKEYLRLIRRNVALLVIATVLGGAAGFGIWALLPTTYSSRTELFASVSTSGDPYQLQMASSFMQERIQTYVDMASSRPVLEPVIDRLNLDETPEELAGQVNSYSDPRTVLITVEAAAATPDEAAQLSDAIAGSLVTVIGEMENSGSADTGQIELKVANPAVPATVPDGLPLWMCIGLGLPVGLAIGLGIALLRSNLDSRLRTKEDVEAITSATVLASIPTDPKITDQPLLTQMGLDNVRGEAYRRLRTNLGFAQVDDTNSAILITSAGAQEGKSTTSINLAIALAQAGSRVALVDVDLRQPTVAEKLGLENSVGLTTALVGSADLSELMQPWGQDELYVLTAGMMPPNPTELLDSRAMGTLIKRLTGEFDIVILDGPPLLPVADSLVLSKQVGRVLLVASVGQVRTNDLQEAVRSLDVLDVPVDVVLNRVPRTSAETNGYYQCYSSRAQKQTAGPGPEIPSDVPPSDVPRTWPGSTEDAWSGRGSEQTAEAASPTWTTSDDATAGRHLRPRRLARTGAQTRRESMGRLP